MIKNLLFDMGGVIFLQDTAKAFSRFQAIGIDTDIYMGAHGQKGIFLDLEEGRIGEEEFRQGVSDIVGHPVSMQDVCACWQGFLGGVPVERLRALDDLRKKYRLGLLSNTNPFMMRLTDSTSFSSDGRPISDYFDWMFLSYQLGAYKPDEKIFRLALEREGLNADETLFIDDAVKNTEATRRVGMHALHVATNEDWRDALATRLAQG